jgi:hypothetical protein
MSKTAAFTLMRKEAREGGYSMDLVERLAELRRTRPAAKRTRRPIVTTAGISAAWEVA